MINILLIVLGCHIKYLLDDRINTAVQLIKYKMQEESVNQVDWFFSGGIKNHVLDDVSEATKMTNQVISSTSDVEKKSWVFIEDTWSTNTADNFFMVKNLITSGSSNYSSIYVVTSEFHHKRAKSFADQIIENNNFEWILSPIDDLNMRYMEPLHLKNVETDIKKSFERFKLMY